MIRIVIDVDDTLCDNKGRDYVNATPYRDVINKVNLLYNEGYYIVLYTARGMKSCNGDLKKIKEKNEDILIEWLQKHNVKYHELIFGKVLGDIYVDDKAMEVREFVNSPFTKLTGGSSGDVVRLGRMVKKDLKTQEKTASFRTWIEENNNEMCKTPHVISYLYNGIYIDYVEGTLLSQYMSISSFLKLVSIILNFKNKQYRSFNINKHFEILDKNNLNDFMSIRIEYIKNKLLKYEDVLIKNASFSHGDTILSNIIEDSSKNLWFIDNNMDIEASSYILDLAKLRMSLDNYEHIFFNATYIKESYKHLLDNLLKEQGLLELVLLLEYMYMLRLYRYKTDEDKEKVISMIKKFEREHKWKIS
jgi:capsule biosynthesis phosphatase